jgi:uncharacterized protein YlaI
MIHNRDNLFYVECDDCGHQLALHSDYEEARARITQNGWLKRRQNGIWLHFCPDCKESLNAKS